MRKVVKAIIYFLCCIVYRVKKVGEENIPKERKVYYLRKSCACI